MSLRMYHVLSLLCVCVLCAHTFGAGVPPASQTFHQELADRFGHAQGMPIGPVQLIDVGLREECRAFIGGAWYKWQNSTWAKVDHPALGDEEFCLLNLGGEVIKVPLPWREVRQVVRSESTHFILTAKRILVLGRGSRDEIQAPRDSDMRQLALRPNGAPIVAASDGLYRWQGDRWARMEARDDGGRDWAAGEVRGACFDTRGSLWIATKAGAGRRKDGKWQFYEGKHGLPWNDFTALAAGPHGEVWFATTRGVIRFGDEEWLYRQGPRWLPNDHVTGVATTSDGRAWFATREGMGCLYQQPMTLNEKAEHYEAEIDRYIRRTPFGYVAEAALRRTGDKTSADPQDSDNDGLWTAMYGAGECFAYGATGKPVYRERARKAFEALRFLQKVTEGSPVKVRKGFVARTVRSATLPDPNIGRMESDRQHQTRDRLWKLYEPRWPRSADGKWYWKSDTSSDELDGHFFFYPLYFEFCAESQPEKDRVREVVRALTDHLVEHGLTLVDHDGTPTRWAIFGPQYLNQDANWWPERGLNSLSVLSYLAVAAWITGDAEYDQVSRELIERHGYAHNLMYPKVQHGFGSGNQSDDEMAFMCYYTLLRYSRDEALKESVRTSFYRYWANESPEMNPFFNFTYAAHNLGKSATNAFTTYSLSPAKDWHADAMATLCGFPLDRINWPHANAHRLDLLKLPPVQSEDIMDPDQPGKRGYRIDGKVLPVENRHFNHWNTDPWQLDYNGDGGELAAGTVFLLPYYMGLYHGFIEKPGS